MGLTETNSSCVVAKKKQQQKKFLGYKNGELTVNVSRRKVAANICCQSLEEHVDLDEQFGIARCLDDKECMWLSSDCMSPLSFFEEDKLSAPFHLYADESLENSGLGYGKGHALHFWESLKEKGGNDEVDSSSLVDTDRISFSESLVNLDGEDSEWISDTESDSEHFQSGFLSQSYSSEKLHYDVCLKQASEAEDLEDLSADEPLFWPFDQEKDWSSEEAWKCFSMSPRKGLIKVMTPQENSVESTSQKFIARKVHPKNGSARKLVLSSGSAASKILELKQRTNNKDPKKIERTPSRLRNSNKFSLEDDHKVEPTETKPCSTDRDLFQDDFAVNEELPIEIVLGLDEFDGHEGVDSDLNEDLFFLEQSL
ncbi:Histone demethylase UTY [Melia azedarach]|uniref:Histone demethylase UTY n=1 Tax=Melia azedarach TaxID=155640 RepID=A0ACC1YIP4_MELAZ|nr:Histone demethylase UTY [Melia azedarach]